MEKDIIGHLPEVIYINSKVPSNIRCKILEFKTKETIFEINRVIYKKKDYKTIKNAIVENDDKKIRNILRINQSIENQNLLISFSFSDFPTKKELIGKNNFEDFLDILHEVSSILFVPHIRYNKSAKTAIEYDSKAFCKYVDQTLNFLNERNTKPIFVPMDIDYKQEIRDNILKHYAKKGYTNIWVDLKGKTLTPILTAKIRSIWKKSNKIFRKKKEDIVIYITNPRKNSREIGRSGVLPSDILGIFTYGDFIGPPFKGITVYTENKDFWKKKGYSSKEEYKIAVLKRESSIFNPFSYYYSFPEERKFRNILLEDIRENLLEKINSLKNIANKTSYSLNSFVTLKELDRIVKLIKEGKKISDYMEEKEYFKNEGKIIIDKMKRKENKGLFEFVYI